MHRELLVKSIEGRRVDLLTITNYNKLTYQYEKYLDNPILHPERHLKAEGSTRSWVFNKPVVFLSARVHPGEVPSSHVLNGLIKFLVMENDESAKRLRDNFVFKIIPCLNPDGVYRGYFRNDTLN